MKHKYAGVWLSDELEGYRCLRCGYEDLEPDNNSKCTYWYRIITNECVLCGAGGTHRIRVYGKPRPEKFEDRYTYNQYLCDNHYDYYS